MLLGGSPCSRRSRINSCIDRDKHLLKKNRDHTDIGAYWRVRSLCKPFLLHQPPPHTCNSIHQSRKHFLQPTIPFTANKHCPGPTNPYSYKVRTSIISGIRKIAQKKWRFWNCEQGAASTNLDVSVYARISYFFDDLVRWWWRWYDVKESFLGCLKLKVDYEWLRVWMWKVGG